jgi:pimeloyl-ACP methyl ester carboxylesterase
MKQVNIDVGGHTIAFYETTYGEEPIILIHGLLDSALGFRKMIPWFDKKYKIICMDIPGFGNSKMPLVKYLYQVDESYNRCF